jgi:hypothetical protein
MASTEEEVVEVGDSRLPRGNLHVGEIVQVRSAEEILATLDERGCVDSLPFMPEMLQFCNKRFVVYRRAHKTCDTIDKTGGRQLVNAVHLSASEQPDGLRCDGAGHGGCEASCLLFWNEAWIKRVKPEEEPRLPAETSEPQNVPARMEAMLRRTAVVEGSAKDGARIYSCQATQLKAYTKPLVWWDVRQYVRDYASGNVGAGQLVRALIFTVYRKLVKIGVGYRLLLRFYNWFQARSGGTPWPYVEGKLKATPTGELNLQPGEIVRVKSLEQILATLDTRNRNRGMLFAPEMVRFCGGTFKVAKRVNRIVDERKGCMMEFSNPCIILQKVFCLSEFSEHRVFCPRGIYPYWREIWLERIPANSSATAPQAAGKAELNLNRTADVHAKSSQQQAPA